jgi:hypothetical protein
MRHNVMSSRETEKRQGRCSRPQFYLSLKGLKLFQVVRGRIAYVWDLGPKSWITRLHDPDPRPYTVLSTPTTQCRILSCCRQIARNGVMVLCCSVSSDRTFLLSSKCSMRWPRSCEPESAWPSRRACPSAADARRSCDRLRDDGPGRRH